MAYAVNQQKIYVIVWTYAVKTVYIKFISWCGYQRYKMMMEINQSLNHTWNETCMNIYIYIYIYIYI